MAKWPKGIRVTWSIFDTTLTSRNYWKITDSLVCKIMVRNSPVPGTWKWTIAYNIHNRLAALQGPVKHSDVGLPSNCYYQTHRQRTKWSVCVITILKTKVESTWSEKWRLQRRTQTLNLRLDLTDQGHHWLIKNKWNV